MKLFPLTYWTSLLFHGYLLVFLNFTFFLFPLHLSHQWSAARKRHLVDHLIGKQHPDGLHVLQCLPAKRLLQHLCIWELHSFAREKITRSTLYGEILALASSQCTSFDFLFISVGCCGEYCQRIWLNLLCLTSSLCCYLTLNVCSSALIFI